MGQMSPLWRLLYRMRSCGGPGPVGGGLGRPASSATLLSLQPSPRTRKPPGSPARGPQPCGQPPVGRGPLLRWCHMSPSHALNLYDGRKWMSGSWKPLKMDPGKGHCPHLVGGSGQPHPRPLGPPDHSGALPTHLSASRESWSCCSRACTLEPRSCFRMASTAARPLRRKLKSPNQKTPIGLVVTSAGGRSGRKLRGAPTPAVCLHPDSRSGHPHSPLEAGGRPDALGLRAREPWGWGVSIAFWAQVTIREPGARPRFWLVSDCRLSWPPWFSRL